MAPKPPKQAVPAPSLVEKPLFERTDEALNLGMELLEQQLGLAKKQLDSKKGYQPKLASQIANLVRAAAAGKAEQRKGDEECLGQVDRMGLPGLLELVKAWLSRCPATMRADLAVWLTEKPMETKT